MVFSAILRIVKNQRVVLALKIFTRLARLYLYKPSKIFRLIPKNQLMGKFPRTSRLKQLPKTNGLELFLISDQAEIKLFGLAIKGKILKTFPLEPRRHFKNKTIC